MTEDLQRASNQLKEVFGSREEGALESEGGLRPEMKNDEDCSRSKTNKEVLVSSEKNDDCHRIRVSKRDNDALCRKEESDGSENTKGMGSLCSAQVSASSLHKEEREEGFSSNSSFCLYCCDDRKLYSQLKRENCSVECRRSSKRFKVRHVTSNLASNLEAGINECSTVKNNNLCNSLLENDEKESTENPFEVVDKEDLLGNSSKETQIFDLKCKDIEVMEQVEDVSETKANDINESGISKINILNSEVTCLSTTLETEIADKATESQNLSELKFNLGVSEITENNKKPTPNSQTNFGCEEITLSHKPNIYQTEMNSDSNNDQNLHYGLNLDIEVNKLESNSTASNSENPFLGNSKVKVPGQSFIMIISGDSLEEKSLFNCVLCFDSSIRSSQTGSVFSKHSESRQHILQVMEVENYQLYLKYKESDASDNEVRNAILTYEATLGIQNFIASSPDDYETKREEIEGRISLLKGSHFECPSGDFGKETPQNDKVGERDSPIDHAYSEEQTMIKPTLEEQIHCVDEETSSLHDAVEQYSLDHEEKDSPEKEEILSFDFSSKTDMRKVIFIANSFYSEALRDFASDKVKIFTAKNLKLDHVKSVVEKMVKEFGPKALWVLVIGTTDVFQTTSYETCIKNHPPCPKPIINLSPCLDIKTTEVDSFISKFRVSMSNLLQDVRAVIPRESHFFILPPFPPILALQSTLSHEKLHFLIDTGVVPLCISSTGFDANILQSSFTKLNAEILSLAIEDIDETKFSSRTLKEYKQELPISHLEVVTGSSDPSMIRFNMWKNCIRSLIGQFLNLNFSQNAIKEKSEIEIILNTDNELEPSILTFEEIKSKSISPMIIPSLGNVYDHLVFIGNQRLLDQIPVTLNCAMSQWNLQFPLDWHVMDQMLTSLYSKADKRLLFIILGDVSTIGMEVYDPQCKAFKCQHLISYFTLGISSLNAVIEGRIEIVTRLISKIKEKFENSKVVSVSPRVRHCIERPECSNHENHETLHKFVKSHLYPCVLEGFTNNWLKAVDLFKREWKKEVENSLNSETNEVIKMLRKYDTENVSIIKWVSFNSSTTLNEELLMNEFFFKDLIKSIFPNCCFVSEKPLKKPPQETQSPNLELGNNASMSISSSSPSPAEVLPSHNTETAEGSPSVLGLGKDIQTDKNVDTKFKHVFIIGKEEIIDPLRKMNLDNVTFVYYFFYSADKNQLDYLLKKMGPLPPNSVCFVTFNLSAVLERNSVLPQCEIDHCQPPIPIYSLKTNEDEDVNSSNAKITIARVQELIELCNELSKKIPVVIMPLHPSKVFFINDLPHLHAINHTRLKGNLFIVSGSELRWEETLETLSKAWNNYSKEYHDSCPELSVIPQYCFKESSFRIIKSNVDSDTKCSEYNAWVDFFKTALGLLLKGFKYPQQGSENIEKADDIHSQVSLKEAAYPHQSPVETKDSLPQVSTKLYAHSNQGQGRKNAPVSKISAKARTYPNQGTVRTNAHMPQNLAKVGVYPNQGPVRTNALLTQVSVHSDGYPPQGSVRLTNVSMTQRPGIMTQASLKGTTYTHQETVRANIPMPQISPLKSRSYQNQVPVQLLNVSMPQRPRTMPQASFNRMSYPCQETIRSNGPGSMPLSSLNTYNGIAFSSQGAVRTNIPMPQSSLLNNVAYPHQEPVRIMPHSSLKSMPYQPQGPIRTNARITHISSVNNVTYPPQGPVRTSAPMPQGPWIMPSASPKGMTYLPHRTVRTNNLMVKIPHISNGLYLHQETFKN